MVSWTNPRMRVDGTRLRDLALVRLFRREEAPGAAPKPAMLSGDRVVGYDEIARIALDAAPPAGVQVQGGTVSVTDSAGLSFGRRYVYVTTAEDATGRSSAPSERLVVTFLAGPAAPSGLAAQAGDKEVRLRWDAPASFLDGAPATGELRYVVLRAAGDGALAPVTPAPIAATTFTDTGLENDTAYRYAVQAVRVDPAGTARGPASAAVAATPVDTTPPSAAHAAHRHPRVGQREARVECEPGGRRGALRGIPRRRNRRVPANRHDPGDHHDVHGPGRAGRPDLPLRRHRAGPRPESQRERALQRSLRHRPLA